MAEVLLRHSWLSILQLRQRGWKLSFRHCKVFLVYIFFFIYFILVLNNVWPNGRQTQCNVQEQEHTFNLYLQLPGCRADSWVTLSVLEHLSLGLHRHNSFAGAKASCIPQSRRRDSASYFLLPWTSDNLVILGTVLQDAECPHGHLARTADGLWCFLRKIKNTKYFKNTP